MNPRDVDRGRSTLIASVTGIGVAGVVGPMASAWATRRANRQQFVRAQAADRRTDLRGLVDEASGLLGTGATKLRMAKEAIAAGQPEPAEINEWAVSVHLLKQRLLLRLPPDHAVIEAFEGVVTALQGVASHEGPGFRTTLAEPSVLPQ